MGSGRFMGPKISEVARTDGGTRVLTGKEAVVNAGTHAATPDIPGLEAARALTHIEALELDYLPSHLIVLGGGYIGIGMAQAYRRFGSRVTIIEPGRELMGREDADVAEDMLRILTAEAIQVLLDAQPARDTVVGGNRRTDDRSMRYVMFTAPPLARVGLSEGEAQRKGIPVRVAKLPMSNVLRTEATDETQGFMKVVVSANDDRILGFTMIGSEAGEAMAAIQTPMLDELPCTQLRDAVITHLTIAEGFGPLFGNVPPRAA